MSDFDTDTPSSDGSSSIGEDEDADAWYAVETTLDNVLAWLDMDKKNFIQERHLYTGIFSVNFTYVIAN